MTTKERTLRFVAYKGLSVKKFEEMCGLSNGYLNSMKSGYGNGKLLQVLRTFPEINRDWLVYGEGEMLIDNASDVALPQPAEVREELTLADDILVTELRGQIERLQSKVDQLNKEIGAKDALIQMLKQGVVEGV